jgi:hypothetical protein
MVERPDAREIRAALAGVLASDGFRSSPRLSRFLEYLVEASSTTFRIGDQPERLTFGSGSEVGATMSSSHGIVLADVSVNFEVWSLPLDSNRGRPTGRPQRITHNLAIDEWPSTSRDGRKLLYLSHRSGAPEIWLKDFTANTETALTADGAAKNWPEIFPDGSSYYFTRQERPAAVWLAKVGDAPRQLCTDCQTLTPLPGGGFLHSNLSPLIHPHLMDATGRSKPWFSHPVWNLHQPQPSPDGK